MVIIFVVISEYMDLRTRICHLTLWSIRIILLPVFVISLSF